MLSCVLFHGVESILLSVCSLLRNAQAQLSKVDRQAPCMCLVSTVVPAPGETLRGARRQSSNMRKAMKLQLFEGILRTVREHVCAFLPGRLVKHLNALTAVYDSTHGAKAVSC